MPLTLAAATGPDDLVLLIEGEVPDSVVTGYSFRLDDELLTLISFARIEAVSGRRKYPLPIDRNRWNVARGLADSERDDHDEGATLEGSSDAWSSSDDTTPPGPFPAPSGPGGDTPSLSDVLAAGADADGHKITGLDDPTDDQDAATKAYVDGHAGGDTPTLADVIAAGADADGHAITGLGDPDGEQDAATKKYVDDNAIGNLEAVLGIGNDADGNKITGLGEPENPGDAATKGYVDDVAAGGGGALAVRNLSGGDPSPVVGAFTFQLDQVVPPTAGSGVITVPLADDPFDVTIPFDADDAAVTAVFEAAFPDDEILNVVGGGAATFAEGRLFAVTFKVGHAHLPIDFVSIAFDTSGLTGGTLNDPAIVVPDDTTPGFEGVDADLVIDGNGTQVWARFAGGFEKIYPAIS